MKTQTEGLTSRVRVSRSELSTTVCFSKHAPMAENPLLQQPPTTPFCQDEVHTSSQGPSLLTLSVLSLSCLSESGESLRSGCGFSLG